MTMFYSFSNAFCRFVGFNCIRSTVIHPERFNVSGGFVLACTHLSHLEPAIVGMLVNRKIDWMARIEFYRYRIVAMMLDALDAFPVNRQGVPVRAIRTAIERARGGRIVGIFPEGGVVHGSESAVRGGPIKKGACLVAYRAAVPILPVVVVGTDKLNRIGPWLPFRRARVWVAYGRLVHPRLDEPNRRIARNLMAIDLQAEFQGLYQELCSRHGIDDREVA